ncbi:PAS domain S-box protein [Deferribacter autotrophicus]|uniref:histidine kinase n=1 Tax=Deferribacter autotrophicus TaxID=500465 RepID=A0A5A8F1I4_9BACT|nr:PAS domain S-box protein [Deferribacter autotrophicus]KAA0257770.1 PAS domain S-box protein [Deferribacter autotrophicus]
MENTLELYMRADAFFFKKILDNLPDIVFSVNKDLTILFANHKAKEKGFIEGNKCFDNKKEFHNICQNVSKCPAKEVIITGKSSDNELKVPFNGKTKYLQITSTPIIINKKTIDNVLITIKDITDKKKIQIQLEERNQIFRDLYEKTSVAIIFYQDDIIIFANPAATKITGYSKNEIVGMKFWELVDDNFQEIVKKRGRKRQEGYDPENKYEILVKRKDGKKRWVLLEGRVTTYNGKHAGLITAIDIHEEKSAKKKLQNHLNLLFILHELNKNLKLLQSKELILSETANLLSKYNDIKCFSIVLLDNNKEISDFITYGFTKDDETLFAKNLEKGLPECINALHNQNYIVLNDHHNNKTCKTCPYLNLQHGSLTFSSKIQYLNNFYGYIILNINAWDRKLEEFERIILSEISNLIASTFYRLEQSMKLSNLSEDFEKFLEENLAAICITTPKGDFIDCNQAFLNLFKYKDKNELKTINASNFYKDRKQRELFLKILKEKKTVKNIEMTYIDKEGNETIVLENAVGRFDKDGNLTHVYSFLYDITLYKNFEFQIINTEKLRSIAYFTAGIAHELNNMLTPIVTLSSYLLKNKDLPEQLKKSAKIIHESSNKSAQLINKLLEFSRESKSDIKILNIKKLINDTVPLIKSTLGENISLIIDIPSNLPAFEGDPIQMTQVILNLTANAKDAMPNGGVFQITANCKVIDEYSSLFNPELNPGAYIELSISDTGVGIAEKDLPKIFEPFYTTKKAGGGTGLGLATSYGIIKKHGGTITAESEVGKGTTFKIYLPTIMHTYNLVSDLSIQSKRDKTKKTILLVDDEDSILDSAKIILDRELYDIMTSNSYNDALIKFTSNNIELAIIDIFLYDKNGIDLAKKFLTLKPEMPIIFISGSDESKLIKEIFDKNYPFFKKPFDAKELLKVIKNLLKK